MKKRIIKVSLLSLAAIAGFTALTMGLWNVLIPEIFGISPINFWQALGLLVLCRILFGMGGHGRFMAGRMGGHRHDRNPIHEKWMKMSPEERKEFLKKRKKWMFGREGFQSHHRPFGSSRFGDDPFDEYNTSDPENNTPKREE